MHLLAGALMSGLYLGPSWWAMSQGMAAGIMSLIGALQPLFTALLAVAVLGKRLSHTTWAGLALGFGGVGMVLLPRLQAADSSALSLPVVLVAAGSIFSLTVGSMVQKSPLAAGDDLRSASAVQNIGAVAVLLAMAFSVGQPHWDNSAALWGYLAFSVLVLSIGGATLLIWLMRRGEATRTTALLLAVPPLSALQAGSSSERHSRPSSSWALWWPSLEWHSPGGEPPCKNFNARAKAFMPPRLRRGYDALHP